jgi:hypothetical protein
MEPNEPRAISVDEVDQLTMEQIARSIGRSPFRDYRTECEHDGTSRRVMRFLNGGRFEVIYEGDRPVDYKAEGVRFEVAGQTITVIPTTDWPINVIQPPRDRLPS